MKPLRRPREIGSVVLAKSVQKRCYSKASLKVCGLAALLYSLSLICEKDFSVTVRIVSTSYCVLYYNAEYSARSTHPGLGRGPKCWMDCRLYEQDLVHPAKDPRAVCLGVLSSFEGASATPSLGPTSPASITGA